MAWNKGDGSYTGSDLWWVCLYVTVYPHAFWDDCKTDNPDPNGEKYVNQLNNKHETKNYDQPLIGPALGSLYRRLYEFPF